jgi:hypothetical protein
MTADRPDGAPDRGGSGPLWVMLAAFAILCAGSLGVAGFFLWRAVDKARERAADAQADLNAATVQAERDADAARQQFERVAKAMAEGLAAPHRLADSYTPDGKPLLSWRVHLLPRLGHADLYRRFKLDEPWDGPNNKLLLDLIPAEYQPPGPGAAVWDTDKTRIRGFSYEGAIFEPFARFTVRDIPAGPDNTLAIFYGEPVAWTRPDGLLWRPGEPRPTFAGAPAGSDWFLAATASGRVVRIPKSLPDDTLRQLFDRRHDSRAVPLPAGVPD